MSHSGQYLDSARQGSREHWLSCCIYFSNPSVCSSMKETWWRIQYWVTVMRSPWGFLQRNKWWNIDVPRPVSLTRILAAGFWLFYVRKQRPFIWKSSAEQAIGLRVTCPNSPWDICSWRWDFHCPRGKRDDKFYSAAYKGCVCTHTYARVHKVLRFVKDPWHIWLHLYSKLKLAWT